MVRNICMLIRGPSTTLDGGTKFCSTAFSFFLSLGILFVIVTSHKDSRLTLVEEKLSGPCVVHGGNISSDSLRAHADLYLASVRATTSLYADVCESFYSGAGDLALHICEISRSSLDVEGPIIRLGKRSVLVSLLGCFSAVRLLDSRNGSTHCNGLVYHPHLGTMHASLTLSRLTKHHPNSLQIRDKDDVSGQAAHPRTDNHRVTVFDTLQSDWPEAVSQSL